jgi:transposase
MTAKQWKRLDIVERVAAGELTALEGARLLRMSLRNFRRLRRRVEKAGRRGVLHRNTGRTPWNKVGEAEVKRIVEFARTTYDGFNDHHLAEKLAEQEKLVVSRSTVRRRLREAGLAAVRKRRSLRHRRRRDRKAQEGLMLLWDGSRHDWLEERGPWMTLIAAIDDATGQLMPGAHFVEQECAAGYLRVLREVVREKGVPLIIYMDRHGSLRKNNRGSSVDEELSGRRSPTQVGRALESLGIEAIYALSPQAKGRVERLWGTLQDRLTSELRLARVTTLAEANAVLKKFVSAFNRRFAVAPADRTAAWRSVPEGLKADLVCAFHYEVIVGNDNAIRMGPLVLDIPPGPKQRSYAKAQVDLVQLLDGSWKVFYKDGLIAQAPSTATTELRIALEYKRLIPGRQKVRPGSHGYQAYAP